MQRDLSFRHSFSYDSEFIKFKGGKIKMLLRQSSIVQTLYYALKLDVITKRFSKAWENDVNVAMQQFLTKEELNDKELCNHIRKDIFKCYKICKSKPIEYFLFGLRNFDTAKRKTFITDTEMLHMLSKTGTRKLHDLELNHKGNFWKLCEPYFKRKVLVVSSKDDYANFESMALDLGKVICKPISMGCGGGIFIAETNCSADIEQCFQKIMSYGGDWIIEELIRQIPEMAQWNPTSVNTIRFTTFKDIEGIHYHCPFMRTGRGGAVVDNGGRGGIYAVIDVDSGKIASNGMDELGLEYVNHPDSKIQYKGWQVPQWRELCLLAKEMHETIMAEHKYIGWDFALTDDGWVVIEGNWGQYVCQQSCTKEGYKSIFEKYLN